MKNKYSYECTSGPVQAVVNLLNMLNLSLVASASGGGVLVLIRIYKNKSFHLKVVMVSVSSGPVFVVTQLE